MSMNDQETVGQVIKRERLRLGLTLSDLSSQTGLNDTILLRIEGDEFKVVDPNILRPIVDALHLDRPFLFSLNAAGIKDEDIFVLSPGWAKLDPEQKKQFVAIVRSTLADAFNSSKNDDTDDDND